MLSLKSLEANIFQDTVNERFLFFDRSISALGDRHDFLKDQLLAVNTDVLEKDVRDQSVLTLGFQESDLRGLVQVLELRLDLQVELVQILLIRLEEEVLGFLAHDFDLAGDSFVHFFLSFNSFFGVHFFRDLSNF